MFGMIVALLYINKTGYPHGVNVQSKDGTMPILMINGFVMHAHFQYEVLQFQNTSLGMMPLGIFWQRPRKGYAKRSQSRSRKESVFESF